MRRRTALWALLASLYTTQFLALGFFTVALVAILRQSGAPLERLGLVMSLGLVWAVKLLWAPLVDRFALSAVRGHYRGWLLATQSGMVAILLLLPALDPLGDFAAVFALCLGIAFLSGTQDIAIDALACRLLAPQERGLGNGIQMAGGLLGNLLGGGCVVMLYPRIGWAGSMVLLAAGTAVSLLQLLRFREPDWPPGSLGTGRLYARLWTFWQRPGGFGWLAMLLFFPLASGLAYGLTTPMMVDAGWSMEYVGFIASVAGSLLSGASALVAGWAVQRWGRQRALLGAALFQIIGNGAMLLPALGWRGDAVLALAVCLYFLCYAPLGTVLGTLMMDWTGADSAATDYSLQYSLFMFVSMGSSALGPALAEHFGYSPVLLAAALAALLTTLLAARCPDRQPAAAAAAAPSPVPLG